MAANRIALALALLVPLCAAQMQICDKNAKPLAPYNTLLTSNTYDAASQRAMATITWRNSLTKNPKGGCITNYQVEVYDANTGSLFGSQYVAGDSMADPVKATVKLAPGKKQTLKIVAQNQNTNKKSDPAVVGTITTASAPAVKPTPL